MENVSTQLSVFLRFAVFAKRHPPIGSDFRHGFTPDTLRLCDVRHGFTHMLRLCDCVTRVHSQYAEAFTFVHWN